MNRGEASLAAGFGISSLLCEKLKARRVMHIGHYEVSSDTVERAISMMKPDGFTSVELEKALVDLGVPSGETAMRAADRALQRAKRKKQLVYVNRRWRRSEDAE